MNRSELAKLAVPFENANISMQRPAGWRLLKTEGPLVTTFQIQNDACFTVVVRDSDGIVVDADGTARTMAQQFASKAESVAKELGTFSTWGIYTGGGLRGLAGGEWA